MQRSEASVPQSVKLPSNHRPHFDAAFIERRFRQHREWQRMEEAQFASDLIREVEGGLITAAQVCAGKGPQRIVKALR